jgi:ABC-type multidrug transport system ATPase subunit
MRRVSALVPQDDLLTPSLTTQEALMEATIFKTSLGLAERQARVDRLLKQFGLDGCKDVIIGHPEGKKGISGGQKRRLSVALELCGRPSLLYLDEPTSGLDSIASMTLVRLLATLARGGVTVIATIHQPSAAAFYTFDRLLLLHQGAPAGC